MKARNAVYVHILLYVALACAVLASACVHGTPFEPDQCVIEADSTLVVAITPELMQRCAFPVIRTTVEKKKK